MKKEFGRSMIEMLGVLSIIGVLSIGGVYGFRQAMNRYNTNRLIDFMSRVEEVFISNCPSKTECNGFPFGVSNLTFICSNMGNVPECQKGTLPYLQNSSWWVSRDNFATNFVLYGVPTDLCLRLVRAPWQRMRGIHADYNNSNAAYRYSDSSTLKFSEEQLKVLENDCKAREKGTMVFLWRYLLY